MTRLKEFLFKYKHAIIILYMPIYLLWFTSLEKRTNVHFTDIHCKIDDYIPFCEFFIAILYRTDTDTNVFPSIHVFNSIAIHFGISRSYYFRNVDDVNIVKNDKKRKAIKIIRLSSLILCILICISTLTLKQHSFLDLVGGCVLFAFYYTIVYIRPFRQTKLSTDC